MDDDDDRACLGFREDLAGIVGCENARRFVLFDRRIVHLDLRRSAALRVVRSAIGAKKRTDSQRSEQLRESVVLPRHFGTYLCARSSRALSFENSAVGFVRTMHEWDFLLNPITGFNGPINVLKAGHSRALVRIHGVYPKEPMRGATERSTLMLRMRICVVRNLLRAQTASELVENAVEVIARSKCRPRRRGILRRTRATHPPHTNREVT